MLVDLFRCRSVIEVRNGLTFLDLIVIQIEVILQLKSWWLLIFLVKIVSSC